MTDTTPEDPEVAFSLVIYPEGQGALVQAAIGLGDPTILLQMVEDPEDSNTAVMKVIAGFPFTQDLEGVNGIADFFEAYVEAIRSEKFQTAWAAKAAARAEEVSETLSEDEEEFWESED